MGKKQHQKDKMYITFSEWTSFYGGKKAGVSEGEKAAFRRLPFYCCSISMQPFEHPYCSPDGLVFDLLNIMPYLKKFEHNPVTGEPMEAKALVKLTFHKNADGKFHCPVTFKVFNENTHIVAVKTTGNVYAYECIERLNVKPKNFRDLLTDEPFSRSDIIDIQDPSNLDKFNLSNFHHLKNNLKLEDEEVAKAMQDPLYHLKRPNAETKMILGELYQDYKAPEVQKEAIKVKATDRTAAHYSTGAVSRAFTSTSQQVVTEHEAAVIDDTTLVYAAVCKKKLKGYVRIRTSKGDINMELHCDLVTQTCDNFLRLCKQGYYNDTVFHRSIKNFMIQGGDPTGTGNGGESAFGKAFKDEFKPNLTHTGRGIVSMANSGPNTNKSQFFISYRSCRHLDNKHTVFGRVVGGMDTLTAMEKVETDKKDRPKETIKIREVIVFVNPFDDIEKQFAEEDAKKQQEKLASQDSRHTDELSSQPTAKVYRKGVGKYIKPASSSTSVKRPSSPSSSNSSKKRVVSGDGRFKDFSSW
ncbi:RING-type E3 ubiquitin-protein ligase PPIL2-like isoform X2 [Corticium candelabrum]|uniref:RING-type E3 ubiquitin-protein ligase PPIL2-like isoform X2 n=1 Tax=Corticium candelabrum TaxID=121492 RepID=UPI002E25D9BA|nr:RING-type E3 ubiquitin-protein ligase PPIL2-like isoform X2 [Corticium candelabrum]